MENAYSDFRSGDESEADLTERELQERLLREADATLHWLEGMAPGADAREQDIEAALAALRDRRRALAESCAVAETAEEEWLQAIADRADAERDLFQRCRRLVLLAQEVTPGDPAQEALAGLVAEWQQRMPLED